MLHIGGGWEETPLLCKALWVPRKALYECNKLLLSCALCCSQMLKRDLRDVFAIYVGFAKELEEQSKQLFECVGTARNTIQDFQSDDPQSECGLKYQYISIVYEYLCLQIHERVSFPNNMHIHLYSVIRQWPRLWTSTLNLLLLFYLIFCAHSLHSSPSVSSFICLLYHESSRVVTVVMWCSVQRLSTLPHPQRLLQEKLLSAGTVRLCVLCVTCTPWWQVSRRACGSYPLSFI